MARMRGKYNRPRSAHRTPSKPTGPRYLFTLVDAKDGSLFSAYPDGRELVIEHTSVSGEKSVLSRVPKVGSYAQQLYDAQHELKRVTGREVEFPRVL